MSHVLICGITESGKTTLAKKLVQEYKHVGISSLVLDPNLDPRWDADFVTADRAKFLNAMIKSRSCALFVDESGESIGRNAKEMMVVTTKSRHFGHKAHLICQRAAQIDPNVRHQCTDFYIFAQSPYDAEVFAQENKWGDKLLHLADLNQGEYLHFTRFKSPEKFSIFTGEKLEF